MLLADNSPAAYVDGGNGTGYLLFRRGTTLMAQALDTSRLEMGGEALPIAEQVSGQSGSSVSSNGVLVYRTGGLLPGAQLSWFNRQGTLVGTVGGVNTFAAYAPALSPDGKRMAYGRIDPQSGNVDIWLYDFARNVPTRFTFDPALAQLPHF